MTKRVGGLCRAFVVIVAMGAAALCVPGPPAAAQSAAGEPPDMPKTATGAQEADALNKLNSQIQSYTPKAPPDTLRPLGGTVDANGASLLNQLEAKGIAVRMVDTFLKYGGTLNVVVDTNVKVGEASAVAKYNVESQTITITPGASNGPSIRANLSVRVLASIAHEFWHAYKAQIVDKGYDPDTAAAFTALKTWLAAQKVTYMEGTKPGATTTLAEVNPALTRFTTAGHLDDFADEYVAAIITDLMGAGPYLGGEHGLDNIYRRLSSLQTNFVTSYFNDNGKNYQVNAAPPPQLMLQLYRLVITNLTPKTETVEEEQPQPQTAPQDSVAPSHSMAPRQGPAEGELAAVDAESGLELGVLNGINLARSHPDTYADELRADSGSSAAQGAIADLAARGPVPPFVFSAALAAAAAEHAADISAHGLTGHEGSDGSSGGDRMHRHGVWSGLVAEEISFGQSAPDAVVRQLMIDPNNARSPHRRDLLDPAFKTAGVACAPNVCVIDLAGAPPPTE